MTNVETTLLDIGSYLEANPLLFAVIILWTLLWKGIALWHSARLGHKKWFIVMLVLNTVGIVEILYILLVARKYSVKSEEVTNN